jgi:2-keto-3-deoxy-L-fuconate dehydrogenase
MTYDFSQKSALITGAASGIGLAVAQGLAAAGASSLVLTDRIAQTLDEATAGVAGAVRLAGHVADDGFWADAMPHLDGLDLAVINAGVTASGA